MENRRRGTIGTKRINKRCDLCVQLGRRLQVIEQQRIGTARQTFRERAKIRCNNRQTRVQRVTQCVAICLGPLCREQDHADAVLRNQLWQILHFVGTSGFHYLQQPVRIADQLELEWRIL
ncbi:hypothetical protein D3C81_415420 [compost metagenome]